MEFRSWQEIRSGSGVNEARVAVFRRLMDAETTLDERRERLALDEHLLSTAIDGVDQGARDADLYLAAVTRYVAALGGRVEVRASFPDGDVVLWRQPDDPRPDAS